MNNAKREKEVLARWRKLIIGVQIRMRLHNDYIKHDLSDMEEEESEFYRGESEGESELYHGDTEEEDNNLIGVDNKDESNKSSETIIDKVVINNNNNFESDATFSDYMVIEDGFIREEKDNDMNTGGGFIIEEEDEVVYIGGFIREENDTGVS